MRWNRLFTAVVVMRNPTLRAELVARNQKHFAANNTRLEQVP